MRYVTFLHNCPLEVGRWSKLGKLYSTQLLNDPQSQCEFIKANSYLTVTKLFALSIQQIFPNFWKICNCIYKQNPQGIKTFKLTLLLSCREYFKKMGFYSCLKTSIFLTFFFRIKFFFVINRLIADIFLYSGCDGSRTTLLLWTICFE